MFDEEFMIVFDDAETFDEAFNWFLSYRAPGTLAGAFKAVLSVVWAARKEKRHARED